MAWSTDVGLPTPAARHPIPAAVPPAPAAGDGVFDRIDRNHDGRISRDEHTDFFRAWFTARDGNGDGVLTADEFPSPSGFEQADADKDRKVTRPEHDAFRRRHFEFLDRNADGALTPDEFRS